MSGAGMPGLGFLSRDYEDLFRPLPHMHANSAPQTLKPPYEVYKGITEDPDHFTRFRLVNKKEVIENPMHPVGCICVKIRLPGDKLDISEIARCQYMKWAVVESLSETITRVGKVRCRGNQFVMLNEPEITDVQMPFLGNDMWQFCDFRFDFKMPVKSAEEAQKAVLTTFMRMVDFEADFCKGLESKFRDYYHITVLGLKNKQYALMDGQRLMDEVALFKAAMSDDADTMAQLLRVGVNVDASQEAVGFPKGLLKEAGQVTAVGEVSNVGGRKVVDPGSGTKQDEDFHFMVVTLGRTALMAAAEAGSVKVTRGLLNAKADVNFQDNSGFHAVYLAAGVPDVAEQMVNLLIANDADVHLQNKMGYTALHNACGCGEVGGIRALLEAKADLNVRSSSGSAPVHVAVINNAFASLEALKEANANLDMPAFGGNTPVHEAVMQNNPEMVQKLFDLKADINIESGPEHGYATPLKMAMDRKKKKAMKKLQDLGALTKVEHDYEESSEGEFEPLGDGEYAPRVKGRYM